MSLFKFCLLQTDLLFSKIIIHDTTMMISLKIEGLLKDANTVGENPTLALNILAKANKQIRTVLTL